MTGMKFMDHLELLKEKILWKNKGSEEYRFDFIIPNSGGNVTSNLEEDYYYSSHQLAGVSSMLERLKNSPFTFDFMECRKVLKSLNLLREFDTIVVQQQQEYENLVYDLDTVHNFILSSRYIEPSTQLETNFPINNSRKSKKVSVSQKLVSRTAYEKDFNVLTDQQEPNRKTWSLFKKGLKRKGSAYKLQASEHADELDLQIDDRTVSKSCMPKIHIDCISTMLSSRYSFDDDFLNKEDGNDKTIYSMWLYSALGDVPPI